MGTYKKKGGLFTISVRGGEKEEKAKCPGRERVFSIKGRCVRPIQKSASPNYGEGGRRKNERKMRNIPKKKNKGKEGSNYYDMQGTASQL